MTEISQPTSEPNLLHHCGPAIIPLSEYPETFSVYVSQYARQAPVVTVGNTDGDAGPPNMWWDFDPETAENLAQQLLHNAALARDFQARVN